MAQTGDRLNMFANTSANSDEQSLSPRPVMLSGLAALHGFILLKCLSTSTDVTLSEVFCVLILAATSFSWPGLRASKRA